MVNNNYTIVQKSTDEPLRLEELIGKKSLWIFFLGSLTSILSSTSAKRQRSNHNGYQFLDFITGIGACRFGTDKKTQHGAY